MYLNTPFIIITIINVIKRSVNQNLYFVTLQHHLVEHRGACWQETTKCHTEKIILESKKNVIGLFEAETYVSAQI